MIVVDTNVVSELMRPEPSAVVVSWVGAQDPRSFAVTSITVAEVLYGIERLDAGKRRDALKAAAMRVFEQFSDAVLAFDGHAATRYPGVVAHRDRQGRPMSGFDAQIAAVCLARGAKLATRNVQDFHDLGLDLVNPWLAA